jgi:hypothetical protein
MMADQNEDKNYTKFSFIQDQYEIYTISHHHVIREIEHFHRTATIEVQESINNSSQ